MRLSRVQIRNFRSIKNSEIEFDTTCRVLVGINESGKSNILKALALLDKDVEPSKKDDLREALPNEDPIEESYVRFVFKFQKAESDKLFEEVSKGFLMNAKNPDIASRGNKRLALKDFCAVKNEGLYTVDILEEKKSFRYWSYGEEFELLKGWQKPTKACPADFVVQLKGQDYQLAKYKFVRRRDLKDVPENYLEDALITDLTTLLGRSILSITEGNLPGTLFWEYDEDNVLPNSVKIQEFADDPSSCAPLARMFILAGVDDIKASLEEKRRLTHNQFQNYLNNVARKTTNHFRNVWKDYKNIEFSLRANADQVIPGIKEKNTHDFARRSDGFKRFITFLLLISIDVKTDLLSNTLLLIDEPDTSLHPTGARYLRDELIRISKTNYVMYSTHSIFMIDSGDISRHYIVRKDDEVTSVEAAGDANIADEEVLYNAVGYSVFAILKEKNIVFEGWNDKQLFLVALESAAIDVKRKYKDIGFCHAKGVKSIKTITPMVELARRECLIVSDSDKTAKEQQKLYEQDRGFGKWKIYQEIDPSIEAITGEDFLKNSYLLKQIKSVLPNANISIVLPEAKGKIAAIKKSLVTAGMTSDQADGIIKQIKNVSFDNLKPQDIEPTYTKIGSSRSRVGEMGR